MKKILVLTLLFSIGTIFCDVGGSNNSGDNNEGQSDMYPQWTEEMPDDYIVLEVGKGFIIIEYEGVVYIIYYE